MEKQNTHILKNKFVIAGIVLVVIIALFTGVIAYAYFASSTENVLDGVSVGRTDLSGKTPTEAAQLVGEEISTGDGAINFVCEDVAFEISPDRINLEVDLDKTVKNVCTYGKEENVLKRISSFYKAKFAGVDIPPVFTMDEAALMGAMEESLPGKIVPFTPYCVETGDNCIIVTNGTDGTKVVEDNIPSLIYEKIKNETLSEPIVITIGPAKAEPIDFDKFTNEYLRDARNADYAEKDGNYVFEKEVEGISFDIETARAIIEENRENKEPYKIPATITYPEITVEDLQSRFASETLATYTTSFASSDANRASNVALAAAKINGKVLNPGDRFSFNGVVGPRTAATGFKIAHVYEGDKIVDGMGGGICQVSSTLYNAVLLADLKIIYRLNHSMPVSYVPLGRDATVSYGTIDFVFENNKKHPVKINATTQNRQLIISISGTPSDMSQVSLHTENAGYTPYSTKEVEDPSLKDGETKVVQNGANGSIVKLYKTYTREDGSKETVFVSRSAYLPTAKIVNVPAKKNRDETEPAQEPKEEQEEIKEEISNEPAKETAPEVFENESEEKTQDADNSGEENDVSPSVPTTSSQEVTGEILTDETKETFVEESNEISPGEETIENEDLQV